MNKTVYHPFAPADAPLIDYKRHESNPKSNLSSNTIRMYGSAKSASTVDSLGSLNSDNSSWSSQHMYRTSYNDMTSKKPVGRTTLDNALYKPHVSNYARCLHSIGSNKASQAGETFNPKIHGTFPSPANHVHMRDTVPFKDPYNTINTRLSKNAGLDGFRENLVKYPPLSEGRDLDPVAFKPWRKTIELRHSIPEQEFNHDKTYNRRTFGSFVPASSTLRAHDLRNFHKETGLMTDGGKLTTCFEMPAGYTHYTAPYSQCWPIAPVPHATMEVVKGRGAPYRIDH